MKLIPNDLNAFLGFDEVVSLNDAIIEKTDLLIAPFDAESDRAKVIFEWVRDNIPHTKDIGEEVVTCTAIEAFEKGTGICFPKSHLLAAMMRHAGIPCGFCYQVFNNPLNDDIETVALHGLNAIFLRETGEWHRIDPRGNKEGIQANFSITMESLAFPEMEFLDACIYAVPLSNVVSGLTLPTA